MTRIIITAPRKKGRKESSAPTVVITQRIVTAKSVRLIDAERRFERRWGAHIQTPKRGT